MKILNLLLVIILFSLISCSSEEDNIDQFIGNWELSNFKWEDCENSGTDRSIDIAVPMGGCFFDGCLSVSILNSGSLIVIQSFDDDSYEYEMPYSYNESNESISVEDTEGEYEGLISIFIMQDELVIPFLEDGCTAEYRMRKL